MSGKRASGVPATKRPDWVSDKDRPTCTSCEKKFTTVRRRHHCRVCGEVYCGGCCHARIHIPELGYTTKTRVCETCKFTYQQTGGFGDIKVKGLQGSRDSEEGGSPLAITKATLQAQTAPALTTPPSAYGAGTTIAPPPSLPTVGAPPPTLSTPGAPPGMQPPPSNAGNNGGNGEQNAGKPKGNFPAAGALPPPISDRKAAPPPAAKLPPAPATKTTAATTTTTAAGGDSVKRRPPPLPTSLPPAQPPARSPRSPRSPGKRPQAGSSTAVDEKEKEAARVSQRSNVITEFVTTESTYVRHLEVIVSKFLMPIRTKKMLPMLELGQIFSNVEIIAMANGELLRDLEGLIMGMDKQSHVGKDVCIGAVFLQHVRNLIPIYTPYCLNQSKCVATYEKVIASKKFSSFASFVQDSLADPACEGLPLMSFLIKPVQRLCKYPLLLRELIKCTHEKHDDYDPLVEAMKLTQNLVDEVNSSKREAENVRKMLQVTKQLAGADNLKLMMPGRSFIMDGRLVKISVHNKHQERQFTLFNDMLIYAAKNTGPMARKKYQFKGMLRLDMISMVDVNDTDSLKHAFCIVRNDSVKKKYVVYAKDAKEKQTWLSALLAAVEEATKSSASGPSNVFLLQQEEQAAEAASSSGVAFKVVRREGLTSAQQLQIVDVENRVTGWKNDNKDRFLIREGGPFTVVYSGGGEAQRYLFLFSDSVLITTKHSEKNFGAKQHFLMRTLQIKADPVGGIALQPKGESRINLCFHSLPEQKSWKADFLRAGALEEGGGWGASQATLTGKIKAVRVRIINPALAEYGLKDTFKTLSLTPETTAAELEQQVMQKVLSRIKPEDHDIVRKGCEGYRLYEENIETSLSTPLPPDAKPYGSAHQILFRKPS